MTQNHQPTPSTRAWRPTALHRPVRLGCLVGAACIFVVGGSGCGAEAPFDPGLDGNIVVGRVGADVGPSSMDTGPNTQDGDVGDSMPDAQDDASSLADGGSMPDAGGEDAGGEDAGGEDAGGEDAGTGDAGNACRRLPEHTLSSTAAFEGATRYHGLIVDLIGTATAGPPTCTDAGCGNDPCCQDCTSMIFLEGPIALLGGLCFSPRPACRGSLCAQVCRPFLLGIQQRFRGELVVETSTTVGLRLHQIFSTSHSP